MFSVFIVLVIAAAVIFVLISSSSSSTNLPTPPSPKFSLTDTFLLKYYSMSIYLNFALYWIPIFDVRFKIPHSHITEVKCPDTDEFVIVDPPVLVFTELISDKPKQIQMVIKRICGSSIPVRQDILSTLTYSVIGFENDFDFVDFMGVHKYSIKCYSDLSDKPFKFSRRENGENIHLPYGRAIDWSQDDGRMQGSNEFTQLQQLDTCKHKIDKAMAILGKTVLFKF